MCRLLAYKGPAVILDDLFYEPEHSIIKQSYHAQEMDEPLNGDGFGIGWYARELSPEPAVYHSIRPAWNNQNLRSITPKISSDCIFAHVRAASVGGVSSLNCHPFHSGSLMLMHNGGVNGFQKIRRPLLNKLSDERFHVIQGQTDSEHVFALFLEHLAHQSKPHDLLSYIQALKATVTDINNLRRDYELEEATRLNLVLTDGERMVGSRLVLGEGKEPLSLYYARGQRFECRNNKYVLRKDESDEASNSAVLIVSERLNSEVQDWEPVPSGHFFSVDEDGTIEFIEA